MDDEVEDDAAEDRKEVHDSERRQKMSDKLSYEGFRNVMLSQVKRAFEGESEISEIFIEDTMKNNDTVQETLIIRTEANSCLPCLHVEDLYRMYEEHELNVEEMAESVKQMFYTYASNDLPTGDEVSRMIRDLECVRPHIGCRLVNGEANACRLTGHPHKRMGEFAVSYYIRVGEAEHGFYVMQIDDRMMKRWGLDVDELHEIAMLNMDLPGSFVFRSMDDMMGMPRVSCMFMLTIRGKVNGATVILSEEVRRSVSRYVGGDYYILPSSIHELIIIPKARHGGSTDLSRMVREVNRTQYVAPEEFLSDNVYEYHEDDGRLWVAESGEIVA